MFKPAVFYLFLDFMLYYIHTPRLKYIGKTLKRREKNVKKQLKIRMKKLQQCRLSLLKQ